MDKEKIMQEAIEYEKGVMNLDEVIKVLKEKKLNNENIVISFINQKLYSLLDDEDSCYKKVTGFSKEEYLKNREHLIKLDNEKFKKMYEEQIKKDAVQYTDSMNLDSAIKILKEKKLNNENIVINFNNIKLYSLLDDEDSCYKKVTGYSKKEYLEEKEKIRERREMNAFAKKLYWLEEGNKFIYPQMREEWEKQVKNFSSIFLWDKEFDTFFDILKVLDREQGEEDIVKAGKILNKAFQNPDEKVDYASMFFLVLDFAKRGPEFCRKIVKDLGFSEKDLIAVNDKIEEREVFNKIFEEELASAKD